MNAVCLCIYCMYTYIHVCYNQLQWKKYNFFTTVLLARAEGEIFGISSFACISSDAVTWDVFD